MYTTVSLLLYYLTKNSPKIGCEPHPLPKEALHIAWLHMLLRSNEEYSSRSHKSQATAKKAKKAQMHASPKPPFTYEYSVCGQIPIFGNAPVVSLMDNQGTNSAKRKSRMRTDIKQEPFHKIFFIFVMDTC